MTEYLGKHYHKIKNAEFDFRKKNLLIKLEPLLQDKTLLDIGCGKGDVLELAKSKGIEAYGIEPDLTLIKLGKQLYGELDIKPSTLQDFKPTQKYDCITMIDVLEHIEDDLAQLKKIKKMLNKGGRLIVVVPSPPWLYGQRDRKVGHFRRYSKKQLMAKLVSMGYKIDKIQYWNMLGFFMYFIYEKILHRDLNVYGLRDKPSITNKILDLWFRLVENNINLGFGMGIICVAK